jgi:hypothetical protein
MLDNLRNSIDAMKNRLIATYPERFRGYGLSNGKGQRMTEIRTNAQWAMIEEQEQVRQAVVTRARAMIEQAYAQYEAAKAMHQGNIKTLTEITLNWCPERVLSTHKDFGKLCAALKDEKTWRALSRKERRFIADAVTNHKEKTQ